MGKKKRRRVRRNTRALRKRAAFWPKEREKESLLPRERERERGREGLHLQAKVYHTIT